MTKLLIIATSSRMLEGFLLPYARHYRTRGWRVDGAAAGIKNSDLCRAAFDRTWEVDWSRNPLNLKGAYKGFRQIQQVVNREEYDIVHVHSPIAGFVVRAALRHHFRSHRPRIVYSAHGFHFHSQGRWGHNLLFRSLEQVAARWTDRLVIVNSEDEAAARNLGALPLQSVRFIPGFGIDLKRFDPSMDNSDVIAELRERKIAESDTVFLVVAEFILRKRHSDVLRAFAQLPARRSHLVLAGDGPLLSSCRRLATDLCIQDRVHFLGRRSDVRCLLKSSHALILVSEHEGLPQSIQEAFASGTLVIGSDIRGNRDLLENGRGILVPLGNHSKLCSAMQSVIDRPEAAKVMVRRSREFIQQLRLAEMLDLHDKLYAELVGDELDCSGSDTVASANSYALQSQAP